MLVWEVEKTVARFVPLAPLAAASRSIPAQKVPHVHQDSTKELSVSTILIFNARSPEPLLTPISPLPALSAALELPPIMALTPMDSVQACWSRISQKSPIYHFFFSNIELVSADKGSILAQLKVESNHVNSKGGLHGSVSATIVDWAGGMVIASHGLEHTGLSTDIHVSYASSAKEGDTLSIEARTTKVGRNMAFTTVTIYKGDGEEQTVVAYGTHTKYILRDVEKSKKNPSEP